MSETPLDIAHGLMERAPDDDTLRMGFYERLADAELFLLLEKEPEAERISPEVFDVADAKFVLVFDTEERLAEFVGKPAPYAALSGRVIAKMLASAGYGIGVNLEVATSAILIPGEAVRWLDQTLGTDPQEIEAKLSEFTAPSGLPEVLLTALDTKLATATGLARFAYLVGTVQENGVKSHMLGFVDALPQAEGALAKAVSEALVFSGIEAGALDVAFFDSQTALVTQLARVGLRFDLPEPMAQAEIVNVPPGSDPEKPPRLK